MGRLLLRSLPDHREEAPAGDGQWGMARTAPLDQSAPLTLPCSCPAPSLLADAGGLAAPSV